MPLVQHKAAKGTNVSTLTATFANPSTAGNALFAWVAVKERTDRTTINLPAGWTNSLEEFVATLSQPHAILATRADAPSITSFTATFTETVNGQPDLVDCIIELYEWSGLSTTALVDQTVSNSGFGTSAASGSTGIPSQADEVVIGLIINRDAQGTTHSGFTGGFTKRSEQATTSGTAHFTMRETAHDKTIASASAQSIGCSITGGNKDWLAAVATLRVAASSFAGTWDSSELDDPQTNTGGIHYIGVLDALEETDDQAATGKTSYIGSQASTEEDDTLYTFVVSSGTWNSTEANDIINTMPPHRGVWDSFEDEDFLPTGEQGDLPAISGFVRYVGLADTTEDLDILSATAQRLYEGHIIYVEKNDTIFTSQLTFSGYIGFMDAIEDDDTVEQIKLAPQGLWYLGMQWGGQGESSVRGLRALGFPARTFTFYAPSVPDEPTPPIVSPPDEWTKVESEADVWTKVEEP